MAAATKTQRSFEGWFTDLAALMAATPAADDLGNLADAGATVDDLRQAGFRPTETKGDGIVVTRKPANDVEAS
jgi:hypothetical protein